MDNSFAHALNVARPEPLCHFDRSDAQHHVVEKSGYKRKRPLQLPTRFLDFARNDEKAHRTTAVEKTRILRGKMGTCFFQKPVVAT